MTAIQPAGLGRRCCGRRGDAAAALPTVRLPLRPAGLGWPAARHKVGVGSGLLLAAATLMLYLLLPQRTLHGVDGEQFVAWVEQGRQAFPRHFAYLHLAGWLLDLGASFGLSAHGALLLASALGSAIGVLGSFRAFALLLPGIGGGARIAAVAAVASAPLFFYATCVEIHGVFFAGLGFAWWAFARFVRRPCHGRAAILGAATGAAASIHAFGHLLPPTFAAAGVVLLASGVRRLGSWLALALLVHAVVVAAAALAMNVPPLAPIADAAGFVGAQWSEFAPATSGAVLLREWLLPYMPWSWLAIAGLFVRRARPWAAVTALGLLLHLPFTTLLLGRHAIDEGGAYHLALLVPAIATAVQVLSAATFRLAILGSLAFAIASVVPQWRTPVGPAFVRGVVALHAERPLTLVCGRGELEGARMALPSLRALDLAAVLQLFASSGETHARFGAWFERWVAEFERAGAPLLLSANARDFFAASADPEARRFWADYVPAHFTVVPEHRAGFDGVWVLSRGGN